MSQSAEPVDLEIAISPLGAQRYRVELRDFNPKSVADAIAEGTATFNQVELLSLLNDGKYAEFGHALYNSLFPGPTTHATQPPRKPLRDAFHEALGAAAERPVNVRLRIAADAQQAHGLLWELLRNAEGQLVALNQQVRFSRYLSSASMIPVALRAGRDLRALVVVANPTHELPEGVQPIDVAAVLEDATKALGGIHATFLPNGSGLRATRNTLLEQLRNAGPFDILYLMCHGQLVKDQAYLLLEDEHGVCDHQSGTALADDLAALPIDQRPRLILLAACDSAGQDHLGEHAKVMAGVGPQLAIAGIPAVIAMLGKVGQVAASQFATTFFRELLKDGQLDRAVAVARQELGAKNDFWRPVLFSRLRHGLLWYERGFADGDRGSGGKRFAALATGLRNGKCLPIIGPDLAAYILGSRQAHAQQLVRTAAYPIMPAAWVNLAQVLQYWTSIGTLDEAREKILGQLLTHVAPPGAQLPQTLDGMTLQLDELMLQVWEQKYKAKPHDPYALLAGLTAIKPEQRPSIYLTTEQHNLLTHALIAQGRTPRIALSPWNPNVVAEKLHVPHQIGQQPTPEDEYWQPNADNPLIYCLFGNLHYPDSLVLSEDDFLRYLIGITEHHTEIPPLITKSINSLNHMYLGFQTDDLAFRVFVQAHLRSGSERNSQGNQFRRVAAQILPHDEHVRVLTQVKDFFQDYFQQSKVEIYWGSVTEFLQDLQEALQRPI